MTKKTIGLDCKTVRFFLKISKEIGFSRVMSEPVFTMLLWSPCANFYTSL
ncbi:unnamed protein product, partial [Porites evermanni]